MVNYLDYLTAGAFGGGHNYPPNDFNTARFQAVFPTLWNRYGVRPYWYGDGFVYSFRRPDGGIYTEAVANSEQEVINFIASWWGGTPSTALTISAVVGEFRAVPSWFDIQWSQDREGLITITDNGKVRVSQSYPAGQNTVMLDMVDIGTHTFCVNGVCIQRTNQLAPQTVTISLNVSGNGTVKTSGGNNALAVRNSITVPVGYTIYVEAIPGTGATFQKFASADGIESTSNPITIQIIHDGSITAYFSGAGASNGVEVVFQFAGEIPKVLSAVAQWILMIASDLLNKISNGKLGTAYFEGSDKIIFPLMGGSVTESAATAETIVANSPKLISLIKWFAGVIGTTLSFSYLRDIVTGVTTAITTTSTDATVDKCLQSNLSDADKANCVRRALELPQQKGTDWGTVALILGGLAIGAIVLNSYLGRKR